MAEYVPRWIVPAEDAKTPANGTDKTDTSPSVSFVSASDMVSARDLTALGLDPSLRWVSVYRGPVEATIPPDGWGGIAPAGCGVPNACQNLGPCQHFTEHGRCWAEGNLP